MQYTFAQISKKGDDLTGVFFETQTGVPVDLYGRYIHQTKESLLGPAGVNVVKGADAKKYLSALPPGIYSPATETPEERFARAKERAAKRKMQPVIQPVPAPPMLINPPPAPPMPMPVKAIDYGELLGSNEFVLFNQNLNATNKPRKY